LPDRQALSVSITNDSKKHETRTLFGRGDRDRFNAMPKKVHAGCPVDDGGHKLHRIEVATTTLERMIMDIASLAPFWTPNSLHLYPFKSQ